MSRQIDVSDPSKLTDEDKLYLQERNRLPIGVEPVEVPTAPAGIGAMTKPEPLAVNQPSVEDAKSANYGEWTVEQLKAECSARDLPVGGKKDELVERLEDNDLSDSEDEDDEDVDDDDEVEDEEE